MELGVHQGVSFEDYMALEAVSQSELKWLAESPALYRYNKDRGPQTTPALQLGTAIHDAVLLPEVFEQRYVSGPPDRRGNKWKDFVIAHEGRVVLTAGDFATCAAIRASVQTTMAASMLLSKGSKELTVLWKHESGRTLKCRLDNHYHAASEPVCVDLKSTADATPRAFMRSATKYSYYLQAAHYLDGISAATGEEHKRFVFIAYEKTPPYQCSVHEYDEESIARGLEERDELLRRLDVCESRGNWPDFSEQKHTMSVPDWHSGISYETTLLEE